MSKIEQAIIDDLKQAIERLQSECKEKTDIMLTLTKKLEEIKEKQREV